MKGSDALTGPSSQGSSIVSDHEELKIVDKGNKTENWVVAQGKQKKKRKQMESKKSEIRRVTHEEEKKIMDK